MPKTLTKPIKVVYPPGCKEVSDELGKDELVKRLKLLARSFQDMGQDDNEQYAGLALFLASEFFLDHASKDVRLLVACCIADVFRIFAPDAPYRDADMLKEIFMFFIKQLRGLEDPISPSFKRYFYLLENLAWVKSFNICIELEDNQEIFCSLYKLMFSIVSDQHSSKVRNFMLDMMTPLITEADSVSQELLDIILLNIAEPNKSQKKQAYQVAKDLLMRTSNAIEPYIQAFFNNTLMLGKTSESEVSDHLYDLIYELNTISPSVLLAVLPQLEFKLKSNEEQERKAVTRLLAKMFTEPGSELALQNKPLWLCYLGRYNDISNAVRLLVVQYSQYFILNHPALVKDVTEQLKSRMHDAEENVRIEVVNAILNTAKKDLSCVSEELIGFIKERTLDKKFKVRKEALLGLAQLYKRIVSKESSTQAEIDRVTWIKDKVFHAYYQKGVEDKILVERILNTCLVPYTLGVDERMKRLLLLYITLDDHAVRAFNELLKHQNTVRNCVVNLLEAHEKAAQGQPVAMNARLVSLARHLPESNKALDHLKKFNQILKDDKRIRNFLKMLVNTNCTCKTAEDCVRDILKKMGNPGAQNLLYTIVKNLLERIAPVMIDSNAITSLVKLVDDTVRGFGELTEGLHKAAEKGMLLLQALSSVFTAFFNVEEVFAHLITFLKHDDDIVSDVTLQIFVNTGQHLQKYFSNIYSSLMPVLQSTAKIGNPQQAKHAIRCINVIASNKEPILTPVFEHLRKSLDPDSANYLTAIVALGHMALLCPTTFEHEMKLVVSQIIVKDLLMMDRTEQPQTTESWFANHLISEETQAKVQAMKMLVRWLLGLKNNANNSGTSTLRLLYTVIIHEGDLMEMVMINKPELARLRLQAGCCMLKLAEEPCFAELITREQFQALALLINDSCYQVRVRFAAKLHRGLLLMRLPLEYMSIFSLAANDPLKERRLQVKNYLQANVIKRREFLKQNSLAREKMFYILPDYVLPYTIHLLAHDPDLKTYSNIEALKNIKECLWFIMEPLISKSEDYNYAFFRRMIENIKQTKDTLGPDDVDMNKKLYAVCDLTLGVLQSKVTHITLKDSNVEPTLPSKLFTRPDRKFINIQSYLPKEFTFDKIKKSSFALSGPVRSSSAVEIIVESPAPVVNPHSTCQRAPRVHRQKNKSSQESLDSVRIKSNSAASTDLSFSQESPMKTAETLKTVSKNLVPSKDKQSSNVKIATSNKVKDLPKKILTRKEKTKVASKENLNNGSETPKRSSRHNSGNVPPSSSSSSVVSPGSSSVKSAGSSSSSKRPSLSSSDEGSTPGKKSRATAEKSKGGVKNLSSELTKVQNAKRKHSAETAAKPSTPTKRTSPNHKDMDDARTETLEPERSRGAAVDSPSVDSSSTSTAAPRRNTRKATTVKAAPDRKNVRRAGTLTNGVSGKKSDSSDSVSPSRTAALTRAIQKAGLDDDSSDMMKRRVRGRKK